MLQRKRVDLSEVASVPEGPAPKARAEDVLGNLRLSTGPTIQIRFRDNELYLTTIGTIADGLRGRGFHVVVDSFPRGTPESEIDQSLSENVSDLIGTVYFSDYTSRRSWHVREKSQEAIGIGVTSTLDTIYSDVVKGLIHKKFQFAAIPPTDPIKILEEHGNCVIKVMKAVFETRRPQRLDILRTDLSLHLPFLKVHTAIPRFAGVISGELANQALFGSEFPEEALPLLSSYYGIQMQAPEIHLRDWMIEAGMPAERIRMLNNPTALLDPKYPLDDDVFVCADQHTMAFDDIKKEYKLVMWLKEAGVDEQVARGLRDKLDSIVVLRQPLEYSMLDLVQWGLLGEKHGITIDEIVSGVTELMYDKAIEKSQEIQTRQMSSRNNMVIS